MKYKSIKRVIHTARNNFYLFCIKIVYLINIFLHVLYIFKDIFFLFKYNADPDSFPPNINKLTCYFRWKNLGGYILVKFSNIYIRHSNQ